MKKPILTLTIIAALLTFSQAKIPFPYVRSVPIWIGAPLETSSLSVFWAALATHGMVKILEKAAEPLDNYKCGIWKSIRSASATITWPDGDYETRHIDGEQFYDYEPFIKQARWWEKDTYTIIHRDGTRTTTITYSQTMPALVEFNQEDVHYKRSVLAGCHCSDFAFDSFQDLIGYVIREGSGAWGRPVTGWFKGWDCQPLWKQDVLYHSPVSPWEDSHFTFIGPSSLGTSSLSLFKLKRQKYTPGMAEVFQFGVVTLIFQEGTF